jgi:hypothetical protein
MTDTSPDDTRDPLRAAFEDYTRPPRDVVPKGEPWPIDRNSDLFDCDGQTATVTYWDRETGRPITESAIITRPVFAEKDR